jgi:hypothetical protein
MPYGVSDLEHTGRKICSGTHLRASESSELRARHFATQASVVWWCVVRPLDLRASCLPLTRLGVTWCTQHKASVASFGGASHQLLRQALDHAAIVPPKCRYQL